MTMFTLSHELDELNERRHHSLLSSNYVYCKTTLEKKPFSKAKRANAPFRKREIFEIARLVDNEVARKQSYEQ